MSANWLQMLAQVAPAIAAAIGGPAVGLATSAAIEAAKALGVQVKEGTPPAIVRQTVERAILTASPAQLEELRKAELAFAERMQALGLKLDELDAGDRANARAREIAVRDRTPQILALAIVSGWFAVLAIMLVYVVPAEQRELVLRMLGTLDALVTGAAWYYLGSSRGSAQKTDAMADAIRGGVK